MTTFVDSVSLSGTMATEAGRFIHTVRADGPEQHPLDRAQAPCPNNEQVRSLGCRAHHRAATPLLNNRLGHLDRCIGSGCQNNGKVVLGISLHRLGRRHQIPAWERQCGKRRVLPSHDGEQTVSARGRERVGPLERVHRFWRAVDDRQRLSRPWRDLLIWRVA